jgi:hypothetical protein
MPDQKQEAWGGEVRIPRWLRRILRRPEPPGNTAEAAHEARKPQSGPSVAQNADRASVGALSDLYREGRTKRR